MMSKLLGLRKWLSISDAAKYLSTVLDEKVSELDLFYLAIEGCFELSFKQTNQWYCRCCEVSENTIEWYLDPSYGVPLYESIFKSNDGKYYKRYGEPECLGFIDWCDVVLGGRENINEEDEIIHMPHGFFVRTSRGALFQVMAPSEGYDCVNPEDDDFWGEADVPMNWCFGLKNDALKLIENRVKGKNNGEESTLKPSASGEAAARLGETAHPLPKELVERQNTNTYRSGRLAILNQASTRFWEKALKDDRSTHPENKDVEAWLIERGFTQSLASKAATIIRPEWVGVGRKSEK